MAFKIGNAMGVNTWMAFAGSDDNAVVDGDFAVSEDRIAIRAQGDAAKRDQYRRDSFTHDARDSRAFCFSTTGAEARPRNWRRQSRVRLLAAGLSGVSTDGAKIKGDF